MKATDEEIVLRWHKLYRGNSISQKYSKGETLDASEIEALRVYITKWRHELHNISSFMKWLNETVSRRSNKEDKCTGHFWESRFKCKALLDWKALLSCMTYVELNPIRANLAKTPESSSYTSIKLRLERSEDPMPPLGGGIRAHQSNALLPFKCHAPGSRQHLPVTLVEFLELVDWSGRAHSMGKTGFIERDVPPILVRLNFTPADWLEINDCFDKKFSWMAGHIKSFTKKYMYFGLPNTNNPKKRNILVF